MDFELQRAVLLLTNLLFLAGLETTDVDQDELDELVQKLLPPAMMDAKRLTADWAEEVADREARVIAAQEQAAVDVIATEEQAEKDAAQEKADQEQRDERHAAGVS